MCVSRSNASVALSFDGATLLSLTSMLGRKDDTFPVLIFHTQARADPWSRALPAVSYHQPYTV